MAKIITASNIEMPAHYGPFPQSLPVFKVDYPMLEKGGNELLLTKRLRHLQAAFSMNGSVIDTGDRLVQQDESLKQVLQVYKPSEAFLYYDRSLVSATDQKYAQSMLGPDQAKQRAKIWLDKQGLLAENIIFEGLAYTSVSSSMETKSAATEYNEQAYRTEIKACFGFQIRQRPVLGPGAKAILSYTGDSLSQVAYFWRNPVSTPVTDQAVDPPESVRKYLASDPRFAHLDPIGSKIRITEINLGYYSLPPFAFQSHYFPVYQLKGIIETRGQQNTLEFGYSKMTKSSIVNETLQYNFNYYLPCSNLSPEAFRLSGFPQPIQGSMLF